MKTAETHHARGFHRLVKLINRRGLPIIEQRVNGVTVRINEYNYVRVETGPTGSKTQCFDVNGIITVAEAERLIHLAEVPVVQGGYWRCRMCEMILANTVDGCPCGRDVRESTDSLVTAARDIVQGDVYSMIKFATESAKNVMNQIDHPDQCNARECWLRSLAGWSIRILALRLKAAGRHDDADKANDLRDRLDVRVRTSELSKHSVTATSYLGNLYDVARYNTQRKYADMTSDKPRGQYHARECAWWALRWLGLLLDDRGNTPLADVTAGIRDDLRQWFDAGYLD